jgi:hypothetical protein
MVEILEQELTGSGIVFHAEEVAVSVPVQVLMLALDLQGYILILQEQRVLATQQYVEALMLLCEILRVRQLH